MGFDRYNPKDIKKIPAVDSPPVYKEMPHYRMGTYHGDRPDQRKMGGNGLPLGPSMDRTGSADKWREWQPGETQRSYPSSNVQNASWYKMHYQDRQTGAWQRKAGPVLPTRSIAGPPSPIMKAAKVAAANKSGKRP
jgi:hypothetical protein